MEFWRNEDTTTFDSDGGGWVHLKTILDAMPSEGEVTGSQAMNALFDMLPNYLDGGTIAQNARNAQNRWSVQEMSWQAQVLNARFVISGMEQRIKNSIVGGGFGIWIEISGRISAELSIYYHRLVCTNGMTRKVEAVGRLEASTLTEWINGLEINLPKILAGVSTGMETLYKSVQVRLGILRPIIPVVLDYLKVKEPDRSLILDAFAVEPGDTLWHFINAFSRAANLVMIAHGVVPDKALQRRYALQKASMRICEEVIEQFVKGKSIFHIADGLRGLLEV